MGRYLFSSLIMAGIFLMFVRDPLRGTMIVDNPKGTLENLQIIASNASQLEKLGDQLETAQKIASTGSDALNTANQSLDKLQTMNSVLGSPLKSSVLGRLMGLKGVSRDYGNLLGSLSRDNSDHLRAVNSFSRNQLGTQDQSDLLSKKDYFKRTFFSEKKGSFNPQKARQIKYDREQASRDSVLTTLAVSQTHKEGLKKDHEELVAISTTSIRSGEMNHHAVVQTKLLERIAQNQEKMILLQAQQLDFMAKTYMGDRGVGLGETIKPKETSE